MFTCEIKVILHWQVVRNKYPLYNFIKIIKKREINLNGPPCVNIAKSDENFGTVIKQSDNKIDK